MRFPLINRFAASVSCAVCLHRALTVIKVSLCLLLPFLLKKMFIKLHSCFKTSKSVISWVNTKISLQLGICQCVQICDVFRVTPTLVWWWLFQAYKIWCFSRWHHFVAFWMGFPHMIILHDKFKMVHCYEVTNQNIPNFLLRIHQTHAKWLLLQQKDTSHSKYS